MLVLRHPGSSRGNARPYFEPNDELTDQVNFQGRNAYEYILDEFVGHRVKEDNPKECSEVVCEGYGFKLNTYEPL